MAECVDESMYELQMHFDNTFLQLFEQVKALDERVTALEQKVFATPFQAEVQVTKDSLKKLRDTIMGMFRK